MILSVLGFGFLLGTRHATDADHVVAVSTIVARNKKLGAAWLLGAVWGLGHGVTIFLVGAAIILLKIQIPHRLGLAMEFVVGLVLAALGLFNMIGHQFPHSHAHAQEFEPQGLKGAVQQAGSLQILRSALVGLAHGLAGSAAVALLVLGAIPTPRAAMLYLLVFGLGTLAGMLVLSTLMEFCLLCLTRWWKTADKILTFATGLLSLFFGIYILYQIGIVEGLLGGYHG